LTLRERPHVPLEAEVISPDLFASLDNNGVRSLPLVLGKRRVRLDDFFEVEGEGSESIVIRGDAGRIKWIGRDMTRGSISIEGNAGMHLGAYMKGGTIEVRGNASDWVGAEMRGGMIRVSGNAGGQIGAAYRGSLSGMNGGTILIGGTAGLEVGMRMKRGIIAVGGKVRDFAGVQMKGGTLILMSGAEIRTGAWMIRGTILSLAPLKLLPTFSYACTYNPDFLRLYSRHLAKEKITIPTCPTEGSWQRYTGDTAVPGKGEILIWKPCNS
jgi:formylmethanofuran dehydrogenase subunit C